MCWDICALLGIWTGTVMRDETSPKSDPFVSPPRLPASPLRAFCWSKSVGGKPASSPKPHSFGGPPSGCQVDCHSSVPGQHGTDREGPESAGSGPGSAGTAS